MLPTVYYIVYSIFKELFVLRWLEVTAKMENGNRNLLKFSLMEYYIYLED